ncbi:Asparagine--tRNA ligase cytoplasmic 2 [Citrus sinensis]|nr:Asparagine--tRNA ligase cytoplasmic 2 [Citrus sinensis]
MAASQEEIALTTTTATPVTLTWRYSNRVLLKTILESGDGGLGLLNERVVIGGWVKTSKEVKKEPMPPPPADDAAATSSKEKEKEKEKDVSFSPSKIRPIGTCLMVEGVLKQPSVQGKHAVELKVEKILHIGTVDHDKYPLSRKRLPMDMLRDSAHFRPRTTTVASVMRIRSSLTHATHTFFQNHGFLYVQVPVITTTDSEGFSEKFQVTTLFDKREKEGPKTAKDIEGVNLDILKASIKEKSNKVEELKRSESNREALIAAVQDLRKTNELVSHLESRDKLLQAPSVKTDKVNFSEDFFSRQTYLTVSGRLHLESYACALGNVYSFGPRFRAEKKESSKHAAEMLMVETEIAFSQLEDAVKCADDYFKFLCKWILEDCSKDLEFVSKRIDMTCIDRLQSVISSSFEKITYTEAVKALEKVTEKIFETKLEWGVALTAEHLSYLADEIYKRPVIVYNYPKAVKPFYVRLNDDGHTVAAFDMVVPKGGTVITGSQNEERIDMLNTRIKELGLPREQYEWYLDLRRHGTVKHSGFSFGFDLMVLFTTGLTDVRDAIPFPRSLGKAYN